MLGMEWNDNLSVGVETFDKQHKKLIDLFNAFFASIQNKEGKERMEKVINGLKQYTVEHFKSEEDKMVLYKFPGYISHKKDHDDFVKAVIDFENRFKQGKMVLTIELTNFIKDWISDHIMKIDKQYTDFFVQKGVK
jgi:hemerythrin-like metal-binding protein